jgi:hypothetical protein
MRALSAQEVGGGVDGWGAGGGLGLAGIVRLGDGDTGSTEEGLGLGLGVTGGVTLEGGTVGGEA